MKKINLLFTVFALCLPAWQPAVSSGIPDSDPDLGEFTFEKWKEGKATIPDYPSMDGLLKVELDRVDTPFNYYIDPKTLTSGKDGVVRYVIVIKSGSGATNVLYEGIRCLTREYRTYAYGGIDGKMTKALVSEWKLFSQDDNIAHRYAFYQHYMCSKVQDPYKVNVILQRIRYPEDFQTSGELGD